MTRSVSASDAKPQAEGTAEIAFIDVREPGQFGEGHPLLAVPCPYSRLELRIRQLVPRPDVRVVLIDAGDGVADRAARRLAGLGYSDVNVISGGTKAWSAAGHTLFKGVNVPSKALGELVEEIWHPSTIDAATLNDWQAAGKAFAFFDARPAAEYAKMCVPGATCLPNGELLYRFDAVVADPKSPVVVTCAGRTRGLVGAIGLKLGGVANPVFALENGTQGWALAGKDLKRENAATPFPTLTPEQQRAGRERARAFAERWSLRWIGLQELGDLRADRSRTLYLFDVRSAAEFAAGHHAGAIHAPSGQIVQATDQWIGVRRARVVLADDNGLRASLAAFWLSQLGFETYVLPTSNGGDLQDAGLDEAIRPVPAIPPIGPDEARRWLQDQAALLDLRHSSAHRAAAPTDAIWAIRPRLPDLVRTGTGAAVLLADEPTVADLAAVDLRELGVERIARLDADLDALAAAGFPVGPAAVPAPEDAIDFLRFVHDRHDGNLDASRRYLSWEKGLVAQLDDGERAAFRLRH